MDNRSVVRTINPRPENIISEQLKRVAKRLDKLETFGGGNVDTSRFVNTTGEQNIDGTKTFIQPPFVPSPSDDLHAVNKEYVDVLIAEETTDREGRVLTRICKIIYKTKAET
jgi:hypothetical protein